MRPLFWAVVGVLLLGAGVLFVLQAVNMVQWPAQSSMIGHREWIERGLLVALLGVGALAAAHRLRKP